MITSTFDPFDPISIIALKSSFELACDRNSLHERADMGIFHVFMKKQTPAALNSKRKACSEIQIVA